MSMDDYRAAVKLGQKEYRQQQAHGLSPYPLVLDELLQYYPIRREESLGLVMVPIKQIVGTKSGGRKNAFASNFMPLLDTNTEFASKWANLAASHLKEGIRDPIVAYEFMNRFYVQEGNKRVSVLKYYGAVNVPAVVRRVIPEPQDTQESKIYCAFLEFYALTQINYIWFSQPERFRILATMIHGSPEPWTDREKSLFKSIYTSFRDAFKQLGGDRLGGTTGDAFLAYLKLYTPEQIHQKSNSQIRAELTQSWNELAAYSIPQPIKLTLDPQQSPPSVLTKLLQPKPDVLRAAFIYERSPDTSAWSYAHDRGRQFAQEAFGERVVTSIQANVSSSQAEEVLCQVAQENHVVFATSPKFLPACIKAAAKYPHVKFLNCSIYTPHPSIRSYYGRMYEIKFLVGLVAGALTQSHRIGYIADYPIYGTTAAINAFALGARMTDPQAQVVLQWRCRDEQTMWQYMIDQNADVIAGQDLRSPVDPWRAYGLYRVVNGVGQQISSWSWNWGRFYQQILTQILESNWKEASKEPAKAINYWWGLSAGVVDFFPTDAIPKETLRLASILQNEIASGQFRIFDLPPEEIVKMDTLSECVLGSIPPIDELVGEARELVRLFGIRQEDREETV